MNMHAQQNSRDRVQNGVIIVEQSQFELQAVKLIPDGPAEQAAVNRRTMEGLTPTEKLCKLTRETHETNTGRKR